MMTFKETMERTSESFDEQIARALSRSEVALLDRGATADELASFRAEYAVKFEQWKAACMAEIARGLADFGAPSGKLQ
ncbi:hypothetical protein CWR43_30795 [Rhizobium sullae]|uniref:Uncharacterized protein n=1 Tax=Rhizobium sullae TaxID=50338 RepID=A0A2N0D0L0_RHISU|nr:hypothetical protein [Rhizobium sullae]PKA39656.1 hypothetical protein CWR43_30795 [Rhizobium sullae]